MPRKFRPKFRPIFCPGFFARPLKISRHNFALGNVSRKKWPIFERRFPHMTPMERAEHHFGPFWEKDFGAISGGHFFSRPLLFTADRAAPAAKTLRKEFAQSLFWMRLFGETDFYPVRVLGGICACRMRLPDPSPVLDKNHAPIGPEI